MSKNVIQNQVSKPILQTPKIHLLKFLLTNSILIIYSIIYFTLFTLGFWGFDCEENERPYFVWSKICSVCVEEKKFERILLITSSMHMRRALLCCEKNNFNVDYFCTDRTKSYRVWKVKHILVPQNQFIKKWEDLIHEMVGFIAYKILL